MKPIPHVQSPDKLAFSYINALASAGPVLLVPYPDQGIGLPQEQAMACSAVWRSIPGCGAVSEYFDEIISFSPWFGIFSRNSGHMLLFYAQIDGNTMRVTYRSDNIIPAGVIECANDPKRLAEAECFDVLVLWSLALAKRSAAKGSLALRPRWDI